MTNTNLFRKGLATSAIAALGVSVLTGVAPASAVDPAVSLELTHGTSTNVKTWDFAEFESGFSLAANPFAQSGYYTGDSGDTWIQADANYSVMPVSYLIESLDGASVYATAYDGYDDHGDNFMPSSTFDYDGPDWEDYEDRSVWGQDSTDTDMVIDGGYYHNVTNRLIIDLENAPNDKASRVKVTAFLDHNGDNEITTGTDESAAPITITFNRPADLSVVTDLAQPIVGDDDLNADVTISPVLNDDTSWGPGNDATGTTDMYVDFTVENTTNSNDQDGHNFATMDYQTYSDGKYTAYESEIYDGNTSLGEVKPGNYEAQAYIYGVAVGNVSRKVVAERHFNTVDFDTDENANLNYENSDDLYTSDYFGGYYTADYATARQGTQVETYTVKAYGQDGEWLPAGSKINLVVDDTEASYTNDYEVKVNGTVAEYGDSYELTVGAEGKATFTVQNTVDRADGNFISFMVQGENWLAEEALVITWEAEYYDIVDLNGDYNSDIRNIVSGGSYTFNFGVSDQWGQAPVNGEYRIAAYGYDRVAFNQVVAPVVNGRASVTVTDLGSTVPQSRDGSVNVELERHIDTDPLYPYWEYLDGDYEEYNQDGDDYNFYTTQYVQAAGSINLVEGDTDIQAAEGAFIANRDNRLNRECGHDDLGLTDIAANPGQLGYIVAQVTNTVTGVIRAGQAVTISAQGFEFNEALEGPYYGYKLAQNSFTSYTNGGGYVAFGFVAHTKGTHTVTLTAGGVTKTFEVDVDNLAAANVAVSQVANSQAGKTLVSTATVTDKWGNSVDEGAVTFASNFGTVPVASVNLDDNGVAVGSIEVGANDLGTATVTATADAVVGTATTTFGITDGHVFKNKKRVTATWEFAKGKTVAIYRDGRRVRNIPVATDDAGKFSFNVKKGKHTVTLKIAGAVVYSYTFNVK